MTYANSLVSISRQPIDLVILTMDYCPNTFGVAPCTASGAACFNTFPTCKDVAHYSKTTKDYKFCSCDTLPFKTGERPYISDISYLPTEIKTSLTITGQVTIRLLDEPDTDVGIDPYVSTRGTVKGTFWKKFIARNSNFRRRPVTIKRGFSGLTEAEYQTRFVGLIEDISFSDGKVTIKVIDPIKSLSDYDSPAKSSCKLNQNIDASSTIFNVTDVSDISTAGGYLRIQDEIMTYTGVDSSSKQILGLTRGVLQTSASTHAIDASIQPCAVYGPDSPYNIMVAILSCFVGSTIIDSTAFSRYLAWPRKDVDYYAIITEPVDAQSLYFELVEHTLCRSWYNENQKITIEKLINNNPNRVYSTVTDAESILSSSVNINQHTTSIVSRCYIYWDKIATGKDDESTSYKRVDVVINADVESSFSHGQTSPKKIYSRWITSTGTTESNERVKQYTVNLAKRLCQWQANAQKIITFGVDIKDEGIQTGSFSKITSTEVEDIYGNGISSAAYQIIKREVQDNGRLRYQAQEIPVKKIALIAPSSAPSFTAASEAQRDIYGYICSTSGKMADGTDGYYIY